MEIGLGWGRTGSLNTTRRTGLTEKTGIDLPAERVGVYYDETDEQYLAGFLFLRPVQHRHPPPDADGGRRRRQRGYLLTPRVVDRVIDQDGNTVEEFGTEVKRQVISEETSAIMRRRPGTGRFGPTAAPTLRSPATASAENPVPPRS